LVETFVNELEVCNSVIGLEADFGDKVNYDNALDVPQFQDAKHTFIDFCDAIALSRLVFSFQKGEAKGHHQVSPTPEREIAAKCQYALFAGGGTEPSIGKVG